MLKSYEELRKIDVSPYCEEMDGFPYLNWAKCIELLHDNGAEKVYFEPVPDERTGSSLRMTDKDFTDKNGNINRCYETRIRIVIDDNEYFMQTPVMNGKNPVKDNSMTQNRIWTSMCRAFVKGVAIHTGLGFGLWLKEETARPKFDEAPVSEQLADKVQIELIKEFQDQFHLDIDKWLKANGTDWEHLTELQAGQMIYALNEKYGEKTAKGKK